MKKWLLRVSIAMVASISLQVEAGMRCESGKLANKNDKTTEVSLECGKPTKIEKFGRVNVDDKRFIWIDGLTFPRKESLSSFLIFIMAFWWK